MEKQLKTRKRESYSSKNHCTQIQYCSSEFLQEQLITMNKLTLTCFVSLQIHFDIIWAQPGQDGDPLSINMDLCHVFQNLCLNIILWFSLVHSLDSFARLISNVEVDFIFFLINIDNFALLLLRITLACGDIAIMVIRGLVIASEIGHFAGSILQ